MIKCPDCAYFGGKCTKASKEIRECKEFKKKKLDTEITRKLVSVDGLNYKFEEVK